MKKTPFRPVALVICCVLASSALLAAGCGKKGASEERGKELKLAIQGEPDEGFDPTTGWGRYGSPLFQSTLLTRDDDLKIKNDLATEYSVSEDRLTWTVKIRGDVKFSDGSDLTADDVAYTYNTAASSGSVVDLSVLERAEAVDRQTVKFTLKKAQSTFLYLLTNLGIVPARSHGPDYASHPVGSGPYRMVQWDRGQQLIVEANPYYYGKKPYFERLTFLFLEEDAAFAAAKAGQLDVVSVPHAYAVEKVEGMTLKPVKSVDNRGIMFPCVPAGEKNDKGYPVGNDVTSDPAIRKAINVGVDRSKLVKGCLEGFGTPAYSICDNLPWWNPETVVRDSDPDRAKSLLEEAGWKDSDGDGVREKGGLKASFTLVYPAGDATRQALAMVVADQVKPLGIEIKVEGKSWDDIETLMHSNAVLFGWGSHDPLEMYNVYSGSMAGNGWYNTGYYNNPTVDAYMEQAMAARGEEEANGFWKKAQWDGQTGFSARGDAPWAWLVNLDHCYFIRDGLDTGRQRIEPHGHGWPITANIVEWRWAD